MKLVEGQERVQMSVRRQKRDREWVVGIQLFRMVREMKAMEEMGVWKVIDCPANVNTIGLKWIFKPKQLAEDGTPIRFKA